MGKVCRSCCSGGGTCNAVISGTISGCINQPLSGAVVTATQGGVNVFTGTVGSSGAYSFTVQSTTLVSISVTHSSGRFATLNTSVTPTCGVTTTRNLTMSPATAYVCLPGGTINGITLSCNWPVSKTLYFTSPSGNTVTLTYGASGVDGAGWYGNTSPDTVASTTVCIPNSTATTTGTVSVFWELMTAAGVFGQFSICTGCGIFGNCYPAPDGTAFSDTCHPFTTQYGCVAESNSFTSLTCPENGAFLLTGTADLPELFSGNWTATE